MRDGVTQDGVTASFSDTQWENGCKANYFQATHCGQWCWLNRTGDSLQYEGDVDGVHAAVCPYRGDVMLGAKYRPWYTWKNGGSWTVLEGYVRWWSDDHGGLGDIDFKTYVREADGKGYHHGGRWD